MKKFLVNVHKELESFNRRHEEKENVYNIFKVLGVSQKEVIMCRMLFDLLNPRGKHGQGHTFLKLFLKDVLGIEFEECLLKEAKVYKEYLIPKSNKRIDIAISIGERFIPIEVKINARDQLSQCYDYYMFALENMKDVFLLRKRYFYG